MNCPRCATEMSDRGQGGTLVSACDRCGGTFVPHEAFVASARTAMPADELETALRSSFETVAAGAVPCPTGDGGRLAALHLRGVEIDRCPSCRGLLFDRGELEELVRREPRLPETEWKPARRLSAGGVSSTELLPDLLLGCFWWLTH